MPVKPVKAKLLGVVALLPVQSPLALHNVAFVHDHDSVLEPLYATVAGLALNVKVGGGGGGATVMATLLPALPPLPLHVRV